MAAGIIPFVPLIAAGVGAASSMVTAGKQRKAAADQSRQAKAERDKQNAVLEKQKKEYRDIKFTNPYENMENTMEDLQVNTQQADFQMQQGNQQRANIMQGLKGAAGSSGIAGLAQAMANQGQFQTQQISASIGAQESQNQRMKASMAGNIQGSERLGASMVQEAESGRQATLLGMAQGQAAGSGAAYQQQMLNQQAANASSDKMNIDAITGLTKAAVDQDWSSLKQ
tara:strand:- start:2065 stop:2745 length:681 start_codon:yes stop_codon:yes gene_type:complete